MCATENFTNWYTNCTKLVPFSSLYYYRLLFHPFVRATKNVPNRYISHDLRYIFDIFHAPPALKKEPTVFVPIWYFFCTISLALLAYRVRQALVPPKGTDEKFGAIVAEDKSFVFLSC